ncbi:MAG: hypothetical protein HPY66_2784 [Firmicutes bacterium]|nr:hypothetical protein [Bacillota bacterium]MDI6706355.1 BON domain-containing protein [Bacillota bacterium]
MRPSRDDLAADRIKDQLEERMGASSMDVNVCVRDGIAHLQGFVDVLAERIEAENIARQVPGVMKVENAITICTEGSINDKHIQKEIEMKLHSGDNNLARINVDVNDGSAVLIGTVSNYALEKQAIQLASGTRGVKNVVSNIRLENEGLFDDATINSRVAHALSTTVLSLPDINTDTYNGEVTLSGWVRSNEEYALAEHTVSEVEGIRKVRNHLRVRSGH